MDGPLSVSNQQIIFSKNSTALGTSLDEQTLAVADLCVELLLGVSVVVSLAYHAAQALGEAGLAPEPVYRITALRCHVRGLLYVFLKWRKMN